MRHHRLHSDWPTRRLHIAVAGRELNLIAPDNPYALLDLPAVEEAFAADEYMPYWAHLWPAACMLAGWLIRHAASPEAAAEVGLPPPPARLLELGCGLALPGLFAALDGYQVTASDYDDDALAYAEQNAELNRVHLRTVRVDWRTPPPHRFPVILAADVLYERRNHQPILECLHECLEQAGLAVLADPNRQAADAFLEDAPRTGWRVATEPAEWEGAHGRIVLLQPRQCGTSRPPTAPARPDRPQR
ncbi:MAG: hypothetical protein BIFFINMI_04024 [Phycisphaerae bacterium]|nr:hypothetical protein [Phycisphaerae bacterium]